ncbi:hypothetical protein, partial [Streptomyces violascens]|uniref:hypothetical protein n=1 Tax=Streptomyces violascens TaxID=67381 RepID=UPI00369E84F3
MGLLVGDVRTVLEERLPDRPKSKLFLRTPVQEPTVEAAAANTTPPGRATAATAAVARVLRMMLFLRSRGGK